MNIQQAVRQLRSRGLDIDAVDNEIAVVSMRYDDEDDPHGRFAQSELDVQLNQVAGLFSVELPPEDQGDGIVSAQVRFVAESNPVSYGHKGLPIPRSGKANALKTGLKMMGPPGPKLYQKMIGDLTMRDRSKKSFQNVDVGQSTGGGKATGMSHAVHTTGKVTVRPKKTNVWVKGHKESLAVQVVASLLD